MKSALTDRLAALEHIAAQSTLTLNQWALLVELRREAMRDVIKELRAENKRLEYILKAERNLNAASKAKRQAY